MAARYARLYWSLAACMFAGVAFAGENWPQWRGPDQNGISDSTGLPETWSETENIVWKVELPSWSGSSPVVWGDRILVTSPTQGETPTDKSRFLNPGGDGLLLLCLSRKDGSTLWQVELDSGNHLGRKQNATSPTPVTDGKNIWVITGTGTVALLTMDGAVVWKQNFQKDYGQVGTNFGYATSPLIHDGKVIVQVLHGYKTDDPSYIMAYDAMKGDVLWRVERPTDALSETPDAYNTPTILGEGADAQIIVCGGGFVSGHDPKNGQEIWRASGLDPKRDEYYRTIASAIAVDGMVYAPTRQKPLLAIRGGGKGDVTESHLAWKWDEAYGPDVPTPACDGKYFYMVDDKGVATCLDAKTGAVIWGPEHTARGAVSASPIVADGKLYITNEDAVTSVLAAGPTFKAIATNTLPGEGHTLSTMAVAGNQIFMRTPSHLYCIAKAAK